MEMSRKKKDRIELIIPPEIRQEKRTPIRHTGTEWRWKLQQYNYRCAYCGIDKVRAFGGYLVREHIVPISRDGTDDIANVVPACRLCNLRKSYWLLGEVTEFGWLVPHPRIW